MFSGSVCVSAVDRRLRHADCAQRRVERRAGEHAPRLQDGGGARLRLRVRRLPFQGRTRLHVPRPRPQAHYGWGEHQQVRGRDVERSLQTGRRRMGQVEELQVLADASGAFGTQDATMLSTTDEARRGAGDMAFSKRPTASKVRSRPGACLWKNISGKTRSASPMSSGNAKEPVPAGREKRFIASTVISPPS